MKILSLFALVQIALLVIASTISGRNVNIFFTPAVPEIMIEVLGGLLLIYPGLNLMMHSKVKVGKWDAFGILMTMVYTSLSMFILAVILKEPKYIRVENTGYYLQVGFSIFVILVLRRKYGVNASGVKT
jgi:hypothetical protein